MRTRLELRTESMATDGRAVARRLDGKVVFVDGALAGERVAVTIGRDRRSYAEAEVDEVLEPSPDRVEPPCPDRARGCGGCPWQHVEPAAQRRYKEEMVVAALRRFAGAGEAVLRPTVGLAPWNYRTTLRAGVVDGRPALRRARSHELVDVPACMIAHPLLRDMLADARFDGASEVLLRCGTRTAERLASVRPRRASVTVPGDVRSDHFHEAAAGRSWRVSAGSFFQSRPDGADALATLVAAAADGLAGPGRAVDLYSGVGLFAGVLADRGWSVTAVEGSNASAADARHNLGGTADVVCADVTRWSPPPADLVVADPSRAGLGRAGVSVVAATGARRVVLVSCDVAAMGRDGGLLSAAGWRVREATLVDLFTHSFRVEVVTVLDRDG